MSHTDKKINFQPYAIDIGDALIAKGSHLPSASLLSSPLCTSRQLSIATGVSGILLYLLKLGRQVHNTKYSLAAETGMESILAQIDKKRTFNYSFLNGHLGIAYALLQLYKSTGNSSYLDRALEIAKKCSDQYVNHPYTPDGYQAGRCGSIIALLHLHAETQENWILPFLNLLVKRVLENADYSGPGLCWNSATSFAKAPLGFAYGTSGIAFTFLELGKYFGNNTFNMVAEKVFTYEDASWNTDFANWPTYQRGTRDKASWGLHKQRFAENDFNFFKTAEDRIDYSAGTAGITLTRLRAYELLGQKVHLNSVQKGLRKVLTKSPTTDQYSILDGKAGHGMLALESYKILHDESLLAFAYDIGKQLIDECSSVELTLPKDHSLFEGLAGVGYYFLQLTDPNGTPSIVLPRITTSIQGQTIRYPVLDITASELRRSLVLKVFGRTLCGLETLAPNAVKTYFSEPLNGGDEKEEFQAMAKKHIMTVEDKYKDMLRSIYELERLKHEMANQIESDALLDMQEVNRYEQLESKFSALDDEGFLKATVAINHEVTVHKTICWPWIEIDTELSEDILTNKKEYVVLLKPTTEKFNIGEVRKTARELIPPFTRGSVAETWLDDTQTLMLSLLNRPKQVQELIAEMSESKKFSHIDPAHLNDLLLLQIKEDLTIGILTFA